MAYDIDMKSIPTEFHEIVAQQFKNHIVVEVSNDYETLGYKIVTSIYSDDPRKIKKYYAYKISQMVEEWQAIDILTLEAKHIGLELLDSLFEDATMVDKLEKSRWERIKYIFAPKK